MTYTAHADTFARDHLPPRDEWPELIFELPGLQYPARMNAAGVLLDDALARGWGERLAIAGTDGTRWTYAELTARANRIANVLVNDLGSSRATACCYAARTRPHSRRAGSAS